MKSKDERINLIKELTSITRSLPTNPDKIGIGSLFELCSVLVTFRERISAIYGEALDDVNEAQKSQLLIKDQFRAKSNELLNLPEIKILKPIAVQQAACEVFLGPLNKAILDNELTLLDVNTFLLKVKMAHDDIKDKLRTIGMQSDISKQLMNRSPLEAGSDPLGRPKGASLI